MMISMMMMLMIKKILGWRLYGFCFEKTDVKRKKKKKKKKEMEMEMERRM